MRIAWKFTDPKTKSFEVCFLPEGADPKDYAARRFPGLEVVITKI